MCSSNDSVKYVQSLERVFIVMIPLLIALYFGNSNVYKVLFLMLIGYILLFTVFCVYNSVDGFMECAITYEEDGKEYTKDWLAVSFVDRNSYRYLYDPRDIKSIAITSHCPWKGFHFDVPIKDINGMTNKAIRKNDVEEFNADINVVGKEQVIGKEERETK